MRQLYQVTFIKKLVDSTGHPVDAAQGSIEISARSQERAIDDARVAFAELKDVRIWSLRADYVSVEPLAALAPDLDRIGQSAFRSSVLA